MDVSFSAEDEAFRQEVRAFFAGEYPQAIIRKLANGQTLTRDELLGSEQALSAKGWLAPNWPREYGGPGWSVTQRFIFDDELEKAGAPNVSPMGLLYVAPIIYTFGTQAQKDRWLPDILGGKTFWAQGYSEPEAGSDLASLQCRAENRGDHYLVNGVKTWTSSAQHADWIFCLVRTSNDGKKQEGITFLCFDIRTPGVEVRPIISIDGGHHLNTITFTDVKVPMDGRIGEEGRGWTYARHLLNHERTSYAHVAEKRAKLATIKALLDAEPLKGAIGAKGSPFRRRLAETEMALTALEYTALRALAPLAAGNAPGDESSILKIQATENAQAITELFLDAAGPYAAPFVKNRYADDWRAGLEDIPAFAVPSVASYFFTRAQTIYGGATEVQKNIIFRTLS